IFIISAAGCPWFHGQRHQHIAQELARPLSITEQGHQRVIRTGILCENVFHMPEILSGELADTPAFGEPGFYDIFFKAFLTLSIPMVSITLRSTRRSAIIWSVQRAAPSGASAQAIIATWEATRVSTFTGWPGRGLSCKRVTILWPRLWAYFRRILSTV